MKRVGAVPRKAGARDSCYRAQHAVDIGIHGSKTPIVTPAG